MYEKTQKVYLYIYQFVYYVESDKIVPAPTEVNVEECN